MESSNSRKRFAVALLFVVFTVLSFGGGLYFGIGIGEANPKSVKIEGVSGIEPAGSAAGVDFGVFWEAWDTITENYLRSSDVAGEARVRGAISGLVRSLGDVHSEYFTPEDNQKFQEDIRGNFGGIGAEIGMRDGGIIVVAPLKGTPAERAGVLPQDRILLVNESSTDGISVENAVQMIRGPEGTTVTLTLFRDGWDEPKEFPIVRETIVIPTIEAEMKEGNIGYIELFSFNGNASLAFYQAVVGLLRDGMKGIVLDLRNNPGGFLETSVDLAGWFVSEDTLIVSEAMKTGVSEEFKTTGNGALKDVPLVILINEGSASAAEILAGGLRDTRKDVTLVGAKSFGKGTVQRIFDLVDGSTMKLTIAHWLLPSGTAIEGEGLVPDVPVEISDADREAGNDPQLTEALRIVREKLNAVQ